jgi:heat shock protein HslJ
MSLEGSWIVTRLATDGVLAPTLEGAPITLVVEGDRVFGKALNNYRGSLGDEKLFGIMATTMMAGPPEVMSQEHVFHRLLGSVDTAEVTELTLSADGVPVLVLRRGESDSQE